MKRILLFTCWLLYTIDINAQTLYVPSGTVGTSENSYVGIGTSAPTGKLHIVGIGDNSLVISGTRNLTYNSLTGIFAVQGNSGGWGMGTHFTGSSGTTYGGFGALGAADILSYWYIGGNSASTAYSNAPLRIFRQSTDNVKMVIDASGNLGLGTTSPTYRLQIQKSSAATPALMIGGGYAGGPRIQTYGLDADSHAWMGLGTDMGGSFYEHSVYFPSYNNYGRLSIGSHDGSTYSTKMTVKENGYVGIGTTSPGYMLALSYTKTDDSNSTIAYFGSTGNYGGSVAVGIGFHNINYLETNSGYLGTGHRTGSSYSDFNIINSSTGGTYGAINFYTNSTNRLKICPNGNVLIGKTTQTSTNYILDVSGKIRADEVVVNTTGADFVFAPGYKLPELSEVESFIKENNHLPDIQPAAEMQENGMNVSEMQTKLLQKIEELTIYIIELNKLYQLQKDEISEFNDEISTLKNIY